MIFDKALQKRSGVSQNRSGSGVLALESTDGFTGWTSEDAVALSREKAMKLSTVSRCVELRANAIAIWRGSLRDDCTTRDDGAFVNGYVSVSAGSGAAG